MKRCWVVVFICLYLTLTAQSAPAQNDWQWQYPLPQGNTLYDVEYFGNSDAIAVGDLSTVIITHDDGSSWTVTTNAAGLSHTLRAVSRPYALNAVAVGDGGTIIRTTDGGITWTAQASGTSVNLHDVFFFGANTMYAVGESGTILKSTNDGSDWIPLSSGSGADLYGVSFIYPDIVVVVGAGGTILQTSDGGSTWTSQNSGTTKTLNAVQYLPVKTVYAIGHDLVLKTTNGGATWYTAGSSFDYIPALVDLSFIGPDIGFIIGNQDIGQSVVNYISTEDAGLSWSNKVVNSCYVFGLSRNSYCCALAVGESGTIWRTSDWGWSWQNIGGPPPSNYTPSMGGLDFWDAQTGVAVTTAPSAGFSRDTFVLRTFDSGESWSVRKVANDQVGLYDIAYADETTLYAVGSVLIPYEVSGGAICSSVDGGANWGVVWSDFCQPGDPYKFIVSLYAVDFGDADHGVAIGSCCAGWQKAIVTIRSGHVSRVAYGAFSGVSMPNATTAYVVGGSGGIFKSTDGGSTWFPQVSGVTVGLSGVHFIDANIGTVVGGGGTILRTWNGGEGWYQQTSGTTENLARVSFSDPFVGYIIGQPGTILKTTDGGDTWTTESSPPIGNIKDVHTINQNNVTIVGDHWSIVAKRDQTVPAFSVVLAARPDRTSVQLEWSIAGDGGIKGFHIYRCGGSNVDYDRLNHSLIPKENRTFTDRTVQPGMKYEYALGVVRDDGSEHRSNIAVAELPVMNVELSQNYPNPFNPETTIRFFLPETQHVKLIVYDVSGLVVTTLLDRIMPFGGHSVQWNARNQAGRKVSSGVYCYQLVTNKSKITRKMVLIQ